MLNKFNLISEIYTSRLSVQLEEKETEVTQLSDKNENLKTEIKQREQKELSK